MKDLDRPIDEITFLEHIYNPCANPPFHYEEKKPVTDDKRNGISLVPKYIDRHGNVTVVKWEDGTVTTVKLSSEDPERYSLYVGYLAALGKKLYGSTSSLHRMVNTHTVGYINAQKAKEKKKRLENAKLQEERAHQRKVKAIAKRMQLEEEARITLELSEEA